MLPFQFSFFSLCGVNELEVIKKKCSLSNDFSPIPPPTSTTIRHKK